MASCSPCAGRRRGEKSRELPSETDPVELRKSKMVVATDSKYWVPSARSSTDRRPRTYARPYSLLCSSWTRMYPAGSWGSGSAGVAIGLEDHALWCARSSSDP